MKKAGDDLQTVTGNSGQYTQKHLHIVYCLQPQKSRKTLTSRAFFRVFRDNLRILNLDEDGPTMAYTGDKYVFINSIEYEYKYKGRYGAPGEKRGKKKKPTPEQIRKQNQINRENRLRRKIKLNFYPDDIWATLKYPKGTRKPLGEVRKDFRRFIDRMRRWYRRRGAVFKYVYRIEIGKRGGIHIHILLNRIRGDPAVELLMEDAWDPGAVYRTSIKEYGGYRLLAGYIVKLPDEEVMQQISLFPLKEQKHFIEYNCSRNLKEPEPRRSKASHWTMRRLLQNGPKPTPGYYIDQDSIVSGVNPYTGMSYYRYTEVRICQIRGRDRPQGGV